MRPRTLVSPLLGVLLLSFLCVFIYKLYFFTRIFYEHSGVGVMQGEVLRAWEGGNVTEIGGGDGGNGKGVNGGREEKIPRIIHQVFHNWRNPGNDSLPGDWEEVRRSCVVRHEGWDLKLWTETTSREFIREQYPWFLSTYDGYAFPIQRVDTIRYFLLRHYGGIYLDLDNGCKTSLTPLLQYSAFLTDGGRGALSNNILGGSKMHSFWVQVTDSLISYDYNYLFPYVTISWASGQWFITSIFENYYSSLSKNALKMKTNGNLGSEGVNGIGEVKGKGESKGKKFRQEDVVRIMMDTREMDQGNGKWVFWSQERGGTWEGWDNAFFSWVGDYGVWVLGGGVLVFAMGWGVLRVRGRGSGKDGRRGYVKVERDEGIEGVV